MAREDDEHTISLKVILADCRYLLFEQRRSDALHLVREALKRGVLDSHKLRNVGRMLLVEGSPELAAVLFEAVLAVMGASKAKGAYQTAASSLVGADLAPDPVHEEFDSSDLEYVIAEETQRRQQRVYEPGFQLFTESASASSEPDQQPEAWSPVSEREGAPEAADWDDTEDFASKGIVELDDPLDDDDWIDDWADDNGQIDEPLENRTQVAADWDIVAEDILEFEEAPTREELQQVQTTGRLSQEERAREQALRMALANGWDENEVLTLQRIFLSYPWAATRTAVQRLIDQGAGPEELALAHELRTIWRSNPEYAASFGLYAHEVLSWPLALSIINSFNGYPAPEELEKLLSDLYTQWYGSVTCRRNFISFRDFVKARIELSINDHLCSPGVDWISDVPESAWESEAATYCGSNSPLMFDLTALGLLPRRRESIFQRVGGIDWNKYDGVASWAAPENYFSPLRKHE